jgi:hypothetical protein
MNKLDTEYCDILYCKLCSHDIIAHHFESINIDLFKRMQIPIYEMIKNSQVITPNFVYNIMLYHANIVITDEEFDAFLDCIVHTMREMHLDENDIIKSCSRINEYRNFIVTARRLGKIPDRISIDYVYDSKQPSSSNSINSLRLNL